MSAEGPLCGLCRQGYYRSTNGCKPCQQAYSSPSAIVVFTGASAVIAFGLWLALLPRIHRHFQRARQRMGKRLGDADPSPAQDTQPGNGYPAQPTPQYIDPEKAAADEAAKHYRQRILLNLRTRGKIMLSFFQVRAGDCSQGWLRDWGQD